MIDEKAIAAIMRHSRAHEVGMCSCPCFDAIVEAGRRMKAENELRVKLAKASPDALAALVIGASE